MTNHNCENIDFSKANMALQQVQQLRLARSYPSINCSIDTEVILTSTNFRTISANNGDPRQSCSRTGHNRRRRLHAISCRPRNSARRGGCAGRAHRVIRTHDGRTKSGGFCARMESTQVNQKFPSTTLTNPLLLRLHNYFPNSADTLPKQQTLIDSFRRSLSQNTEVFKKVYKATFILARTTGQKSLQLDTAIEYWRLLLQSPSRHWATPSTPWLEWWVSFLEERWRKGVSKDMWDQTGIFVLKSLEDESMGWWSEDGAWPGVLDEFVGYVRERRKEGGYAGVGAGAGGDGNGDVEMK